MIVKTTCLCNLESKNALITNTHRSCSTFLSNADSRSVKRMLLYKSCNLNKKYA